MSVAEDGARERQASARNRARNRTALALARVLYRAGVPAERAARLSEEAWEGVAEEAHVHVASVSTRGIVLTIMAALEEFGAPREPVAPPPSSPG